LELFAPVQPLVDRLGAEFFRTIPQEPGVYRFHGADGSILYVGKAKNLRDRLGSYRSLAGQARKTRRLIQRAVRIDWDLCASEAEALAKESRLIKALKPKFNRAGVWTAPPWYLRLAVDGEDLVFTRCLEAPDVALEGTVGPLRSNHAYLLILFVRTLWLSTGGYPEPHTLPRPLLFPGHRWSELRVPESRVMLDAIGPYLLGVHCVALGVIATHLESIVSPFSKGFLQADLEVLQDYWDHHPLRRSE
jgi:hypothetical protein